MNGPLSLDSLLKWREDLINDAKNLAGFAARTLDEWAAGNCSGKNKEWLEADAITLFEADKFYIAQKEYDITVLSEENMKGLSKYHNTTVRIVCENGETFTGACEWDDPEYNLHEYNVDKESLRIGEYIFFEDNIRGIELLRREACFPVRDWPEANEEIAAWFHERWHIPLEAYRESINDCLGKETGIPQWYVVVRGNRIIAGCGVIENDFHERKDLAPNVCAVYVDEAYRNQGIAGFMLQYACDDLAAMGFDTLYLLTDHTGFYERYGWRFLCMARGNDGALSRMYVHHSESPDAP